jgi:peptidoglycan/xylan/chitin deacetylase (PgdA/CDA1 family)
VWAGQLPRGFESHPLRLGTAEAAFREARVRGVPSVDLVTTWSARHAVRYAAVCATGAAVLVGAVLAVEGSGDGVAPAPRPADSREAVVDAHPASEPSQPRPRGRPIGCVPRRPLFRVHGPRGRRRLSLTFDGGPSRYTPGVLRNLRRFGARATFFLRGDQIRGRAHILRRTLRAGHELANHSYSHPHLPSFRELARTNRLIRRLTGFEPCLFRPPFGAWSSRLIGDARRLGMLTIYWDVDSHDSVGADAATLRSRVVGLARGGSIVLMHDGPGQRRATRIALPRVLRALRRKGYRMVTVSELLGLEQRFSRSAGG